jgi:hypothetical protein
VRDHLLRQLRSNPRLNRQTREYGIHFRQRMCGDIPTTSPA